MPKVKKSTKKDPPEKVLADLAKKYPQLLNLTAPPQRGDKLRQGEERSVAEKGADVLRALSQPLNYMREVGEGNYVPTQAELESKGISPMEQVGALANPMDHIYAALAEADVIDDPNYAKEDGVSYGSPALLSLITGSAPQRVSKGLDKSIKVLKEAGIKNFGELNSKDINSLSESAKEAAKDVARVVENSNQLGKALRSETGLDREFITNTDPSFGLRNYIMDLDSPVIRQYDPNKPLESDPFIRDMLNMDSDLFARDYLTSYRGVVAENPSQAEHFMVDPGGLGNRAMGEGVYTSQDIDTSMGYADARKYLGDNTGYVGKVRQRLGPHGWKNTLRDLAEREFLGSAGSERGMKTTGDIRVVRPEEAAAGGLQLQDIATWDDFVTNKNKAFKKGRVGSGPGVTPKYYNERSLEFGETPDEYIRSFFKSRNFNQGGKFKVKKKAQEGMRVKKSNGDPPKGYTRDADGYLTPIGFNEFHEEGGPGQDPTNYLNIYKLDSILESEYGGSVPFSGFRDAVRRVEAGPNSEDPYTQRQEVEVIRNNKKVKLPVGVGRGAYQFDYPSAQTAYTRLKSIADKRDLDYPDLSDDDLRDVSKLDPEIQDMLFTAHFAKDKKTSVASVLDSEDNWADQYQIGHYKGEKDRRDHFRSLQ
tara:strand:+ start:120 stop:2066 length:1947 start_codon:yes stop_codon:yes gene_type:complete